MGVCLEAVDDGLGDVRGLDDRVGRVKRIYGISIHIELFTALNQISIHTLLGVGCRIE